MSNDIDTDMDTADVLDAAADYIRMHGLGQGNYGGCGGPACLVGAVREASGAADDRQAERICRPLATVGAFPARRIISLEQWNDATGRTAAEVITALMEAAARVRTGEVTPLDLVVGEVIDEDDVTPRVYVILSTLALRCVSLVAHVYAMGRAAARRRASLEPVVLLPKCVAVPAAWRKRIGWWM